MPDSQSTDGRSASGVHSASDWRKHWSLDPAITFLNHGSFGACPIAILEKQQSLRTQLEQEPVRFFELELETLLDAARQELANFVGANAADLVFIPNATTGVNTVLRSLVFRPGDELLTTNHEYNASRNALDAAAHQAGATVVVAEVPFPIATANQVIEAVLTQVSSNTRLVLLDHVTSQTGLVFPIVPLIRHLTELGIEVLIDGAHAPGMIPLNLSELGATYYTGNCHKWLCAPKGAAFLYVQPDRQSTIRPLVVSHGANSPRLDRSRFHLEFDWMGTSDPTPYLCVAEAIRWMSACLPGGWTELMSRNRQLVLAARQRLCEVLEVLPPCPDDMIGSMAIVPLSKWFAKHWVEDSAEALHRVLLERYHIEVPVIPWQGSKCFVRVSAQLYNALTDYDRLADALLDVLSNEGTQLSCHR
jgi:isopenicillin-N epimerase